MRRIVGLENLDQPGEPSAVTIGKFFAVHRGHQALLQATVAAARQRKVRSVALTFDRHPLEVLRPGTEMPQLADLEERLDLIEAQGVDATVVARVTPEFLAQEPEAFVRDVLVARLGARIVIAAGEFRFGRGARGTLDTLRHLGPELGLTVETIPPVLEGGERISSSRVASCIEAGAVDRAAALLGRPYSVRGAVIRGEQIGRQLGYPTANIRTDPKRLLPADGVYAARARWDGEERVAAVSLGVRPVLGGRPRLLEAYLLDWSGDLYGRELQIEFVQRLRSEQAFPNLDALKEQIARDVEETRRIARR